MFQSRRLHPVLQCATLSRPDLRRARSLARASLAGASLLALAACGQAGEEDTTLPEEALDTQREVLVTAAFSGGYGDVVSVAFLPRADAAALGAIIAAPRAGGLDLFDADGARRGQHAGPRLSGLATAPGFQLRGENLPLIFGAAADGSGLQGFAVLIDEFTVLDLPLPAIEPADGVAGVCLLEEGIGYVDLVILGTGASAEIWRVSDSGDDAMAVDSISQFPLPAPARECASLDGEIFVLSPASGVSRIDRDGRVQAELAIAASNLSVGSFNGTSLVLTTSGINAELEAHFATDLMPAATITIVDGLSTPGIAQAGPIAITDQTYGYTAYSQGMLAVFDRDDERIKVISREAFTRAYFAEE